jgi:OmpA-OmpF porin, OOP family
VRICSLAVTAAFALGAMSLNVAHAQTPSGYATSSGSGTWKSGTGLCWRTGYWTPAMATAECDPDLVAKPPPPPVAPRAAPAPTPPAPIAKPAPPKPTVINLASSELFEFNKATLTPTARAKLDTEVIAKIKDMKSVRFINVNGHTDRLGGAEYNQKLSERRADAVKAYLVSKGADASKIETYGFGKTLPIKACPDQKNRKALIECLAPNRRVEVEIQGQ